MFFVSFKYCCTLNLSFFDVILNIRTATYFIYVQEISSEEMNSVTFTIKEINSVSNCPVFTSVAICSPSQLPMVHELWKKAFTNTDILFCGLHEKLCQRKGEIISKHCN